MYTIVCHPKNTLYYEKKVINIKCYISNNPQRAVMAPLLFNLFTPDQPITVNTVTGDFADGKVLLELHSNPETASNLIQNLLSVWYKEWRITG